MFKVYRLISEVRTDKSFKSDLQRLEKNLRRLKETGETIYTPVKEKHLDDLQRCLNTLPSITYNILRLDNSSEVVIVLKISKSDSEFLHGRV